MAEGMLREAFVCNKIKLFFRSLGRYSSEEDSDTDVKITKKDKGRRTTMAAPVSQVTSRASGITLRKSNRFNDSDHLEQVS